MSSNNKNNDPISSLSSTTTTSSSLENEKYPSRSSNAASENNPSTTFSSIENEKQKQAGDGSIKSVYEIMQQSPKASSSNNNGQSSILIPYATPNIIFHSSNNFFQQASQKQNQKELSIPILRCQYLPYFLPYKLTTPANEIPPDFGWLSESCSGKAAIGIFGGGIMGLIMGVFLGAMSDLSPPVTMIDGREVPQAPIKEQMRTTLRATAEKSRYWCRQFAFITGVFGGSECLVEKYRGKHDIWNPVASGCITGAALQAKSGPQAAALGCGGFAAFSIVIDLVMGH